jgi:hypothetical protein
MIEQWRLGGGRSGAGGALGPPGKDLLVGESKPLPAAFSSFLDGFYFKKNPSFFWTGTKKVKRSR